MSTPHSDPYSAALELADQLDPVAIAVTLSLLPADHALVAAARAALDIRDRRRALREASIDVSTQYARRWPR